MLKINSEKCIGCETCKSLCSKVFEMDSETGKAKVVSQEVGDCDVQNAIDTCPADAISNN